MMTRLFDTLVVMLGVSSLVFFLIALVPGDPVDVMLGETAATADREAMRQRLGLDRPVLERWVDYLAGLARGDLGVSLIRDRPVADLIAQRLPATAQLAAAAFTGVVVLVLPLGMLAAARKGSAVDRFATLLALIGQSIPNFWLGPILVLTFSVALGWLPVSGAQAPGSIILPALTLGLSMAAVGMRMLRASLLEIASADFLRTARAKGAGPVRLALRHALPNALLPVITLLGLQLGALLAGAVITEVVFAWPGIGSLLIDAIRQRDYPLVQGVVLVIALFYVLSNQFTDLLLRWIDPRIREASP